jgi:hypothetical protein
LLDGTPWHLPDEFGPSLHAWSIYERHELLSIAFQGLFWAALTASEAAGRRTFRDATDLAQFAVGELRSAFATSDWARSFGEFVLSRSLPPMSNWSGESHEVQAGWRIVARESTPSTVTADAGLVLAALVARASDDDPYARLHFEADYFERYPINLRSFLHRAKGEWAAASLGDVLAGCVSWSLRTHWRVALQKLGEAVPRDTFKVRPLDGAIQIVQAPAPTFSVPRIHRVVGILRDLGLIYNDDNERPVLTKEGGKLQRGLLG